MVITTVETKRNELVFADTGLRSALSEGHSVVNPGVGLSVRSLASSQLSVQGTSVSAGAFQGGASRKGAAARDSQGQESIQTTSINATLRRTNKPLGFVGDVAGAVSGIPPRGRPVRRALCPPARLRGREPDYRDRGLFSLLTTTHLQHDQPSAAAVAAGDQQEPKERSPRC